MSIRRAILSIMIGLCCALGATTSLSAQATGFFKRYTGPQVVANPSFSSQIVLLNTSTTTCNFGVFAHTGANRLAQNVVIGGQPGGFTTGSLAPDSGTALDVEAPQGNFLGAATVDLLTPECFNAFTVQFQYRLRSSGGRLTELFSYPSPQPLKPGQCAVAAVNIDTDSSDGITSVPGFASVSVNELQDAQLCHTLKDRQGKAVTQEVCNSTDGSHMAQLVTDIFKDGFESGDVSSWQVCLDRPTGGTRVDPLFIDVINEQGAMQFDANEHQIRTPGCQEDEFTACLDDRFQVSLGWRETPLGPTRRAKIAAVTPDQSGYFYLLNPSEIEVLVKVLNGCEMNDNFWFFYAATTNLELDLIVTDTQTNQTQTYNRPANEPFQGITDTSAFATCP